MFEDDYVFNDNRFNNKDKIIFHIDVNSAYLSWTAVKLLQYGDDGVAE